MSEKRKDHRGRILRTGESQRKDKTYMYRYNDSDGERRCIYAKTLDELRQKAAEIERRKTLGIVDSRQQQTVLELVQASVGRRSLRATSVEAYQTLMRMLEREAISRQPIGAIKTSTAKEFIRKLERDGRSYSTIRTMFHLIKSSYNDAVADDLLVKNPFAFSVEKVVGLKQETREALTPEQQEQLMHFVREHPRFKKRYNELCILLGTGLRISELYGLTLSDLDFEQRKIVVNKQLIKHTDGRYEIVPPKTASGVRTVPMTDDVRDALCRAIDDRKKQKSDPCVDGHSGFLFITTRGHPRVSGSLQITCGIIEKEYNTLYTDQIKLTPHVLRHTFCTNLEMSGINIKCLQYVMGHSKADVTLNTYTHVTYADVERAFFSC